MTCSQVALVESRDPAGADQVEPHGWPSRLTTTLGREIYSGRPLAGSVGTQDEDIARLCRRNVACQVGPTCRSAAHRC
jgi:hypothetical protein